MTCRTEQLKISTPGGKGQRPHHTILLNSNALSITQGHLRMTHKTDTHMKLCSSWKGGKVKEGFYFYCPVNHSGYIRAKRGESEVRGEGERWRKGERSTKCKCPAALPVYSYIEQNMSTLSLSGDPVTSRSHGNSSSCKTFLQENPTQRQCWWWELLHTFILQKQQAVPSQLMAHTTSCNVCNKMWKCHKHVVLVCLFVCFFKSQRVLNKWVSTGSDKNIIVLYLLA